MEKLSQHKHGIGLACTVLRVWAGVICSHRYSATFPFHGAAIVHQRARDIRLPDFGDFLKLWPVEWVAASRELLAVAVPKELTSSKVSSYYEEKP